MKTLQHDLSANETKVSFDLLVQTARIAVAYARTACERSLNQVQDAHFASEFNTLAHSSQTLANAAADLAVAANTLHVLTESKSREVFTLIGKPPVVND
jgi:hypothetical protein